MCLSPSETAEPEILRNSDRENLDLLDSDALSDILGGYTIECPQRYDGHGHCEIYIVYE